MTGFCLRQFLWPHRLSIRTSGSHPEKRSLTLLGATSLIGGDKNLAIGIQFSLRLINIKNKTVQALELLKNYKEKVNPCLEKYFKEKLHQAGKIDSIAEEAVCMIRDYTLAGGKRIRPAVLYYGYLASGGTEEEKIVEASMSIELLHSFLLIHDDIIDRDAKRHGVDTMHERFRKISSKYGISKDDEHFGNSMAIIAGDMTASMACDILFNSQFSSDVIIRALDKLQEIVFVTIPGEMLDVIMGYSKRATEEQILKMHEGKTARYTFEGPAHLGCLLAGGEDEILKNFSEYSLPLGRAFQVRDDILGVFGDEKKLGKPVGSDVIEGKQTLLVIKALEQGDKSHKEKIKRYLGKKDLSKDELEEFRQIMKETGSLDYSQKLAEKFVGESLESLSKINFKSREAKDFFEGIARYMVARDV